jgi:hypothetical protein
MSLITRLAIQKIKNDLNTIKNKIPESIYNFFIFYFFDYKFKQEDSVKYINEAHKWLKYFVDCVNWGENKEITINCNSIFNFDGEIKTIMQEAKNSNPKYASCKRTQDNIRKYSLSTDTELKKANKPIILLETIDKQFILIDGYHRLISRFKYSNRDKKETSIKCTLGSLKIPFQDII